MNSNQSMEQEEKEDLNEKIKKLQELERKEYLDERKSIIETLRETANSFDKSILTISSALLAFSLTFIKNSFVTMNFRCFLILTWVFFLFSIIIIIINMKCSQNLLNLQSDEINYEENKRLKIKVEIKDFKTIIYNKKAKIKRLNNYSLICLITGIIFLIIFSAINL